MRFSLNELSHVITLKFIYLDASFVLLTILHMR